MKRVLIIVAALLQVSAAHASPRSESEPGVEGTSKRSVIPVASRGLTATLLGGGAMGSREGESLGIGANASGALGFELRLRRSALTVTPELLFAFDRYVESGVEYGAAFAGARLSYYLSPDSRRGLMLWTGMHVGVASQTGDKEFHPTFLFGGGLTYMFVPHVGLGLFGDASWQTAGAEFAHTAIEQQGGGTLSARFGISL
jgi:hypothetical protein